MNLFFSRYLKKFSSQKVYFKIFIDHKIIHRNKKQQINFSMTSAQVDLFEKYECLRNDKTQKRFISIIDLIRNMILHQAQEQKLNIVPFPSEKLYLAAICSLLNDRLTHSNFDGLPELLRCLSIALESTSVDKEIASGLLSYLLPLFSSKSDLIDLQVSLSTAASQLMQHVHADDSMVKQLVQGLCSNALSDDSRLRASALKAIYDFSEIQTYAFDFAFEIASHNPLRALTIAKNLCRIVPGAVLSKHFQEVLQLSDSANRSVRVKSIQIIAVTIQHMPVESAVTAFQLFSSKLPEAPGDLVEATTEIFQSVVQKFANTDISILKTHFPAILHSLLLLLTIGDENNNDLIEKTILYGLCACIKEINIPEDQDPAAYLTTFDGTTIQAIVLQFTTMLGVQFIGIWPHVYKFLETLPALLRRTTYLFLKVPLRSSLEKMTNPEARSLDMVSRFVYSCANEMGLEAFFQSTELPPNQLEQYDTLILPILTNYSAKKHSSDLGFTMNFIMPVESHLQTLAADSDESRLAWGRLWNALPNCVSTNKAFISENQQQFDQFIDYLCTVFADHKNLVRPISKMLQYLGPFCDDASQILTTLANAAIDQSTSSSVIPAIASICNNQSTSFINNFFEKLLTEKVLGNAVDPSMVDVACALIDILIALIPSVSADILNKFYQVLIAFIQQRGHLQKKALRTLRVLLEKRRTPEMQGASAQLVQVLNETNQSLSSSTIRYRLLLMSTLLQLPDDHHGDMILNFLPEFVAALKDPGQKTRDAGVECIYTVADELVKGEQPLGPVLSALSIGLTANVSTLVSASIDAITLIFRKYYSHITPEELNQISMLIWKSTESETGTEISRSALSFASSLVKKVPKFVASSQLQNILLLSVKCIKKTSWEIKGKGRKLIDRCIEQFGVEPVTQLFPPEDEKLLRNARKEHNRDVRKKSELAKDKDSQYANLGKQIELDERFDVDARDLNDPRETIVKVIQGAETPDKLEGLEFDQKGRLVLKEANPPTSKKNVKTGPRRDGKGVSLDEDDKGDDDEDVGNEVALQIRQRRKERQQQEKQRERDQFIAETGNKFKASKGKGDRQKDGQLPYSFAPLSSKTVNKRYRGQMKAAYKKLFKSKQ